MKQNSKASFNARAFVALTATIAGLGLPVSGYVNHLFQMDSMTIQRHAWMSAHIILGVIFTVFAIWHAILNRRALFNHVKDISTRIPFIRREVIFAISVVALGLFFFVGHALVAR
jgi:hypothetical protein